MKRGSIALTSAVIITFVFFNGFSEASSEKPRPVKTGILLVAFGAMTGGFDRITVGGPLLASEEEGSWKNILARAGIKSTPVLTGAAEYDDVGMIWVEHLKAAVARLEPRP